MSDISDRKIRQLDGAAMMVFLGLMQHRRTTIVAKRMGLTQSAISQTLRRLRALLEDPLFLRRPHGLEPTAVALELEPSIRQVVDLMRHAVGRPQTFDPGSSTRTIRIAATEYEFASIVPQLLGRTGAEALRMRVFALPLRRDEALARLADGTIDLVLGFYWDVGGEFGTVRLYDEHYELVMRRGHRLAKRRLTVESFAAARHLFVTPDGDQRGIVDEALAAHGHHRDVAASVPLFLPALASLALGDLVACLPSRLARAFCPIFGLERRKLPFAVRSFPVSAVYHRRNENSPVHRWILGTIEELIRR